MRDSKFAFWWKCFVELLSRPAIWDTSRQEFESLLTRSPNRPNYLNVYRIPALLRDSPTRAPLSILFSSSSNTDTQLRMPLWRSSSHLGGISLRWREEWKNGKDRDVLDLLNSFPSSRKIHSRETTKINLYEISLSQLFSNSTQQLTSPLTVNTVPRSRSLKERKAQNTFLAPVLLTSLYLDTLSL